MWFFAPPPPFNRGTSAEEIKAWSDAVERAKSEAKETYKRTGLRWVYSELVKQGWFGDNPTPLYAVYNADAWEAFALLSLKNAEGR